MIFYVAGSRFFALKGEAIAHCSEHRLKRNGIHKVTCENRDEMVRFLNGLVADTPASADTPTVATGDVPECVPRFLRERWARL